MAKIDLVTGFLGAGKTTFLLGYARYLMQQGERIAILENDYGAINVDALLLSELEGVRCEIETVAGGCDYDCHLRRFKTKLIALGMQGFDRVLVEPSGIYDVDEFFDVLCEDPLDRWYQIGNVITIIDPAVFPSDTPGSFKAASKGGAWDQVPGRETRYFLLSQTAQAGRIVLSHVQKADGNLVSRVVRSLNQIMEQFGCSRKIVCADVLGKNWDTLESADYEQVRTCGYQSISHIKLPILDENGFSTAHFLNPNLSCQALKEVAAALLKDSACGTVLRVKGFHLEAGQWYELNASRDALLLKPCPAGQELLIVIGEHLDRDAVRRHVLG